MARRKLLVVEDEPVQLRILPAGLSAEGFDVVIARDGVQAVGMVRKELPNLVLLDAVSARSAETAREKMLALGADDYFQKPVDIPGLIVRINELLPS